MINEELEKVLDKLKELVTEIELLVYPVRNIYDEQDEDKVLPDNYA